MGGVLPKVMCPGCLREMHLTAAQPSIVPGLQSATFHCDECGADTKREIKIDKNATVKP